MKLSLILVTSLLAVGSLCCAPRPVSRTVPLVLAPSDPIMKIPLSLPRPSYKLYLAPVVDHRPDTALLGHNLEKSTPVAIIAGGSAAIWVQESLVRIFQTSGIEIQTDPDAARDRTLNVSIAQFLADENPGYQSRITLDISVTDASGAAIWQSSATGDNSTIGHSLSAENYQQTLSDSIIKLADNLMLDPAFVQAIAGPPPAK